jgi:hypothetical protein
MSAASSRQGDSVMKRFSSILVSALVIALGAGISQAAPKGNKPAKPDKAGKREHTGVAGIVSKVEGSNIVVQTRGKNGAEVTIATDGSTKFEGVNALADIKAGMRVMATPNTGTAQKVIVQPGRGAGKGAAKKNKNIQ